MQHSTFEYGGLSRSLAAQPRLPQHRHRLAEGVEAGAAVVGAHAAGADAAERQVVRGEMQQRVVDGDAAGERARRIFSTLRGRG